MNRKKPSLRVKWRSYGMEIGVLEVERSYLLAPDPLREG